MDDNFLIPANSKKSMLIFGFFTVLDLIIFLLGVFYTIILLFTVHSTDIKIMLMILLPALISTFLVLPVPYYHNMYQLIINTYTFITKPRKYLWKGWCAASDKEQ